MKKYLVLGILFVLPILAYMFFASGVNNFGKLPILNDDVTAPSVEGLSLQGRITILGFPGDQLDQKKTNALNLNQKIYKRFNGFDDLQFVMLLPEGNDDKIAELKSELGQLADISNWNFIQAGPNQVSEVFNSLGTPLTLDEYYGCNEVFIIDKEGRLRGREKDDNEKPLYGYDATSVAVINNIMVDDVKIILAEYRLAKKENNNGSEGGRNSILKKNVQ
ncbi:hypothetical protein E7Z59_04430 [Robertkochia marina]|uniref:Redoxin domain-containing protein n=1 Tax=Robertkochia marina TaxID=1227945 RepID=A0A4V3UYG8_9FLAO|nr:hypothetical protein [Robertkochia marina]THD69578.1 hypothetical protein E7Z59_04430 [Robertkochia marina]TRZ47167.1 hypothetical protein D3A96_00140 [Robertkochia marina]